MKFCCTSGWFFSPRKLSSGFNCLWNHRSIFLIRSSNLPDFSSLSRLIVDRTRDREGRIMRLIGVGKCRDGALQELRGWYCAIATIHSPVVGMDEQFSATHDWIMTHAISIGASDLFRLNHSLGGPNSSLAVNYTLIKSGFNLASPSASLRSSK